MKNKIILVFVVLFFLNLVSASYYYSFNMKYSEGNLRINDVNVEFSQKKDFANNYNNGRNFYFINIFDNKNMLLERINFSLPNFVIYDLVDEKGEFKESKPILLDNIEFKILSNYYENGYKAILYDSSGKQIDYLLLSQFSKNNFSIENFRKNQTNKEVNLEDVEKIEVQKKDYNNHVKILIILLLVLIIILIVILKNKI